MNFGLRQANVRMRNPEVWIVGAIRLQRAYWRVTRKLRLTKGKLAFLLGVAGIMAAFVVGQGAVSTGIQIDLSSGEKRRVLYIFNADVRVRPETPMWLAEYATEPQGDWRTVSRRVRWPAQRVNWRWTAAHASLLTFGEWLRETHASDDVKRAAGERLLRLMRSEENLWLLVDVMNEVSSDMVEAMERDEPLDAEGIHAAFGRAEAARRNDEKP